MSAKIYMQFNDIQGNGTEAEHTNWISLSSCNFSVSRCISQESGSEKREIGITSLSSLSITKEMDISSIKMFSESLGGFGSDVCTIHFVNGNGTFLEYKLSKAVISSYNLHASEGCATAHESFTINFTRMETKYTAEKNSPSICAGYDIPTAKNL